MKILKKTETGDPITEPQKDSAVTFTVEMTGTELGLLGCICDLIGGNSNNSPRGFTDKWNNEIGALALKKEINISTQTAFLDLVDKSKHTSINFRPTENPYLKA